MDVEQAGKYTFSLRRWPEELGIAIDEAVSEEDANSHIYAPGDGVSNAISPVKARLALFGEEYTLPVKPGMTDVTFELDLEQTGETQLEAWFADQSGEECGAYYVYVERVG